jgi:hypothetical protein
MVTEDTMVVRFRMSGDDIDASTMGWPDLRDFTDLLVRALKAMPNGPEPRAVMPVSVTAGSLVEAFRIPRDTYPAVRRLQRGPTKRWSRAELREVDPLYRYLRERHAQLGVSARGAPRLVVVPPARDWTVTERISTRGEIFRVGGRDGRVEVRFDGETTVKCTAGRELAAQLAQHLYRTVLLEGLARRDATTGVLESVDLTAFTPDRYEGGTSTLARELREILGDSMADFDPVAYLREIRG